MALSKVNFNSLNVTPAASKAIKFNSNNNGIETGDVGGSLVLLETQTLSSAASTMSFTSNIDSTYKEYIFKFIDIHPASEYAHFSFQADTGTNTNYNQTITSAAWTSTSNEGGTEAIINYQTASDQGQGTGFQYLTDQLEADNDSCAAGTLHIFDPSNTTFVKQFFSTMSIMTDNPAADNYFTGGKFNTTSAINAVQFKFASGNVDAGDICLYGIA